MRNACQKLKNCFVSWGFLLSPVLSSWVHFLRIFYLLLFLFQVSWIRKRDAHILTVDHYTFIADERFQSFLVEGTETWTLQVSESTIVSFVQWLIASIVDSGNVDVNWLQTSWCNYFAAHIRHICSFPYEVLVFILLCDAQVKYVQARDQGEYECQVSTEPKMSHFVTLNVVGKSLFGSVYRSHYLVTIWWSAKGTCRPITTIFNLFAL